MDGVGRRDLLGRRRLASLSHWQPEATHRWHAFATKYFDLARIWVRKAVAPGGITGVIMSVVLVIAIDLFLLLMRSLQALPPVSLTFMIAIVVVALRWGVLSSLVTTIGGALSLTYSLLLQPILHNRP